MVVVVAYLAYQLHQMIVQKQLIYPLMLDNPIEKHHRDNQIF